MADISSAYTDKTIKHTDGVDYAVIDGSKLDFSTSAFGKKTAPTHARIAHEGESIVTKPGSTEESAYIAKAGDVVFTNKLPGGVRDEYVPRDGSGQSNGGATLQSKYELVSGDLNSPEGATFQPKGLPSRILHEAVDRPTVIENAWGAGSHQFLDKGATLKLDGGKVTGIDKTAFDATWSLTDAAGKALPAAAVDTDPFKVTSGLSHAERSGAKTVGHAR